MSDNYLRLKVGKCVPFGEIQVGQWCTWNEFLFVKTTMSDEIENVRFVNESWARNIISNYSLVRTIEKAD